MRPLTRDVMLKEHTTDLVQRLVEHGVECKAYAKAKHPGVSRY